MALINVRNAAYDSSVKAYVAALTELSWLLVYVKLVLCVTKPNDKLVSQYAARSGSPHNDKIITLVLQPQHACSSCCCTHKGENLVYIIVVSCRGMVYQFGR